MHTILAAWLGGTELILVLVVVLVLFGARKVPELMKGLGTGIKEFKKATREVTDEIQNATEDKPQPQNKAVTAAPSQPAQTVAQSSNPSKV